MNKVIVFFAVALTILVISVVLTPPVHWLLSPFFRFEKIFNRLVMILAVGAASLFVLSRRSRDGSILSPKGWRECGFDFSVNWKRLFSIGFMTGTVTVLLLAVVEAAIGPRYWRHPLFVSDIVQRFFKGLLSGMAVGIVEEFFFRGFVFVYIRKKMNLIVAVILGSAFYSLTHFFDNGQIFIPPNPTAVDALRLLFGYLEPVVRRPLTIMPEFTGLFLFGVVLTIAFIRTKSLFLGVGLHAGSVFLIKFQHSFIRPEPPGGPVYDSWFGLKPFYDGPAEWIFLLLLGLVVWRLSRNCSEPAR